MPALFAYLIAIGLLLGGGYGALSWLAAPEPVKVAAKAKPKPPSHYAANSEIISPKASSRAIDDGEHPTSGSVAAGAKDQQPSPVSEARATANAEDTVSAPAQDQKNRSAIAEVPSAQAKPAQAESEQAEPEQAKQEEPRREEIKQPALAASPASPPPASPSNQQAAAPIAPPAASTAPTVAAAKMVKRPHPRQAAGHTDKRGLALMTLRTIEFPDGRRVTQLIPYHSYERSLAVEPDE